MVKAVLTHRADSIYDDLPEKWYHFPETYLRTAEQAIGDWIVYYEPRRGDGRQVYFAVARLVTIRQDPSRPDHYYAYLADYLEFPNPVPFRIGGDYFESMLQRPDGKASKGAFGRSVRLIPDAEFDEILKHGLALDSTTTADLSETLGEHAAAVPELADDAAVFERPMVDTLTRRRLREAAFARLVKQAYEDTCAMTGLCIRNGGGRAEVQAAHIRPVAADGPDTVRNGLALSGTVHWMFDRGLISVDEDGKTILIARDRVPDTAERLIVPDKHLILPRDPRFRPHAKYLEYHRSIIFKG